MTQQLLSDTTVDRLDKRCDSIFVKISEAAIDIGITKNMLLVNDAEHKEMLSILKKIEQNMVSKNDFSGELIKVVGHRLIYLCLTVLAGFIVQIMLQLFHVTSR